EKTEIDLEPSADVLEHAGDIYFMDGAPDKALEFWKRALALDPDNDCLARKVKHKTYFYN
ncbi:MAG: tetratricopeptide repeat protein, partial [Muribaculaceae bacterium]|nr:tetratricopeptide repeat protein [Muribaculaceae bacterium]